MGKRGRAPKGEYTGKSEVMSFRITPDTKTALRRAAATSGRSLSQEAEHRLRRGLDEEEAISSLWGDVKTSAMLRLAAQVVQSLGTLQDTKVHWTADAKAFDSAIEAIAGTLKLFRPLQAEGISVGPPEIGAAALKIIEEAQATELSRPLRKSSRRQRAVARFKEDLGQELTNRAIDRIHERRGVPAKPAKDGS
jgi:plasmid stability protein